MMDKNRHLGEGLALLREAMRLLLPVFNKAYVPWKNEDAYDGWDRVAEALYLTLVVESTLQDEGGKSLDSMPRYGFTYQNYDQFDILPVLVMSNEHWNVFHSFHTESQPFDVVRYASVDKLTGEVVSTHFVAWERAVFVVKSNNNTGPVGRISEA